MSDCGIAALALKYIKAIQDVAMDKGRAIIAQPHLVTGLVGWRDVRRINVRMSFPFHVPYEGIRACHACFSSETSKLGSKDRRWSRELMDLCLFVLKKWWFNVISFVSSVCRIRARHRSCLSIS